MSTSARAAELAWLKQCIRWLPEPDARAVYNRASCWMSIERYGLDERQFPKRDTTTVGDIGTCRAWLANLIPTTDDLLIVFSEREVCATTTFLFLDHWQDMFVPARDDVLITNRPESWVLFYHHENQFQFARIHRA